jgi:hypothetical protein
VGLITRPSLSDEYNGLIRFDSLILTIIKH